jgi:hypothetical protein
MPKAAVMLRQLLLASLLLLTNAAGQIQISNENVYNPVPSPDGKKIAAVRTGWSRQGGSGGLGRSNLLSEVIVLDRTGRILSTKPLADSFVASWNSEGVVTFRDWSYALISEDGTIREQGRVCSEALVSKPTSGCVERVAYLPSIGGFVWVHQKFGDSTLMTPRGELSPHHHDKFLGEWLVPSPDQRYIAAGPGRLSRTLNIYHVREKSWLELAAFGAAVVHPDQGWEWMEPSWSPWFADSSQLTYFTTEGLIVISPDGKRTRQILRTEEPAGLAVPSPDGRAIAYATFASRPRTSGGGNLPIWNCTGIWVVGLEGPSLPRRLTGPTPSVTYDLRWLDNDHLVFDRIDEGIPPKARLWTVAVDR